jgi:hypothetical protein
VEGKRDHLLLTCLLIYRLKDVAEPYIFRHLQFFGLDHVRRAAYAMNQARQREKFARWTRIIIFSNDDREPDHLFFDFAAIILAYTPRLTELDIENGIATNSMLAIVSATAGGSLHELNLAFGANFVFLFAQIGQLHMLRSLTLEANTASSGALEGLPLDTTDPWRLPLLHTLCLMLSYVEAPTILFGFLSRCYLKSLTTLKVATLHLLPNAVQALSTLLRNLPDLVNFAFEGHRSTLDALVPDLSCRSLHIGITPSAHMAASLSARIRIIVVAGTVVETDDDGWELTPDNVRDFLQSLSTNSSAQSELIRIQLELEVAHNAFPYPRFSWHSDDALLTMCLGKFLPHALRLRNQGVTVTDYEDRSLDQ